MVLDTERFCKTFEMNCFSSTLERPSPPNQQQYRKLIEYFFPSAKTLEAIYVTRQFRHAAIGMKLIISATL